MTWKEREEEFKKAKARKSRQMGLGCVLAIVGSILTLLTLPYGFNSAVNLLYKFVLEEPVPKWPFMATIQRLHEPLAFWGPYVATLASDKHLGKTIEFVFLHLPGCCCASLAFIVFFEGLAVYLNARSRKVEVKTFTHY